MAVERNKAQENETNLVKTGQLVKQERKMSVGI